MASGQQFCLRKYFSEEVAKEDEQYHVDQGLLVSVVALMYSTKVPERCSQAPPPTFGKTCLRNPSADAMVHTLEGIAIIHGMETAVLVNQRRMST